jgi:hypothetical protein
MRLVVAMVWVSLGIAACAGGGGAPPGLEGVAGHTKIDDMEKDGGEIQWTSLPGARRGRWSSYVDGPCQDLEPSPAYAGGTWFYTPLDDSNQTFAGIISINANRLRTLRPLINRYGAGMRFDFAPLAAADPPDAGETAGPDADDAGTPAEPSPCSSPSYDVNLASPARAVDLRGYTGITFWAAAVGDAKAANRLNVLFLDANTDPRGGVCDPDATALDGCYNAFRASVDLNEEILQHTIDFSSLAQRGYQPSPSVIDLEHVYQLAFQIETPGGNCPEPAMCPGEPPQLSFDVWLDDLYFVDR